jgi:hypothetical protein
MATSNTTPTRPLPSPPPDLDETPPAQLDAVARRLESDTATVLAWLAANARDWVEDDADEGALLRHLASKS